jgi:tetratricopeptide (TPR) repeat protein
MRPFFVYVALLTLIVSPGPAAEPQTSAVRSEPPPGYFFMLGRHLESQGKIAEAIAAHKRAIELEPGSAELHAELAGLYARQDRTGEAVAEAEAAVARDPASREANRILGSIYAAYSDQQKPVRPGDDPTTYTARAIAALEKGRRERGLDVNLELMLGRLYLRSKNVEKAIPSLRMVVDDQPGYPEAALLLAGALETAGRTPEAISTLDLSVQGNPAFVRGHVKLAELYEKERLYRKAADAYALAQAANPRLSLIPQQAAALLNSGDATAARDLLQRAIARKAPAPEGALLYLLGQAQRQLKEFDAATETVQKLKAISPNDPRTLYLSARLLDDRGRNEEALAAFQDLMKRTPDDASLVYEYANLLEKNGRIAEAERALRDRLAKDPLDANALNALGYMFAERGERLDEAIALVQRALKVEPANPSFLDSLGWAHVQQGKLDLADAPLTEAAEKLPSSSAVQDHLGDLRFKQQRYGDAVAAWERSLAGDGEAIDRTKIEQKLGDVRNRLKKRLRPREQ